MKAGRTFSVELKSRSSLRELRVEDSSPEVSVYGDLGGLRSIGVVDDAIFVIIGENGLIRIDLTRIDFERFKIFDERKV